MKSARTGLDKTQLGMLMVVKMAMDNNIQKDIEYMKQNFHLSKFLMDISLRLLVLYHKG
jgi:hypothetical protein